MKKIINKFFLFLVIFSLGIINVSAENIDPSRDSSLNIKYQYDTLAISNTDVSLYFLANIDVSGSYQFRDSYLDISFNPGGMSSTDVSLKAKEILSYINKNQIPSDYSNFCTLYKVESIPSLLIFEPNEQEGIISQKWVGKLPTPEQFALYILEGVVEEEQIVPDINEKMTRIVVTTPQRKFSEQFHRSDAVCVLYNWLNSEFGPHHSYTLASTNEPLTKDVLLIFREAGLYPEVELIMHDENYGSMALKSTLFGHEIKTENNNNQKINKRNNIITSFFKKIKNIISYINPCASDIDDSDDNKWEFKPSNNPDIAAVVARNFSQNFI